MALSWVQKQILKINPKAIEGFLFKRLDDETVSYAIEHGYLIHDKGFMHGFLRYPSFLKKCLEMDSERINYELSQKSAFSIMPQNMIPQVIQKLLESPDFILTGSTLEAYELLENPDLWLKTVRKDPESIKRIFPVSYLDIPELKRGDFLAKFMELGIPLEELSSVDQQNEMVFNAYLDKDPISVYENVESLPGLASVYVDMCEKHFMSNIDKNIRNINAFRANLEKLGAEIWAGQKKKVIDSAIRQNYTLKSGDYFFLFDDPELSYRNIMAMEGEFNEAMAYVLQYLGCKPDWTEEQQKDIAHKLCELRYRITPKDQWITYERNRYILGELLEENPFYINDFDFITEYNVREFLPKLEASDYVVTRDTPSFMLDRHVDDFYIELLEGNFEEVVQNPNINMNFFGTEYHKKIYEICKENGYVLSDDAPGILRRNPYLVRDAIRSGSLSNILGAMFGADHIEVVAVDIAKEIKKLSDFHPPRLPDRIDYALHHTLYKHSKVGSDILIPKSSYMDKEDTKITIESARRYFPSIRNSRINWRIHSEEQQEIARLYFEFIDSHPNEVQRDWREISLIGENPYVYLEQIRRGDRPLFLGARQFLTYEMEDLEYDYLHKYPAQKNTFVLPERIRVIRELLSEDLTVSELTERLKFAGIKPFLDEKDTEDLKSNPTLVMSALSQDFSLIEQVSKVVDLSEEQQNWVIERALEENYEIKEDSLYFLRNNKEIALQATRRNPEELQYFYSDIEFDEKEQNEILEALIANESPIVLHDNSFDFLKTNERYIRFSLEHSSAENLENMLDNIELDELSFDLQRVIYAEYISKKDEINSSSIEEKMHDNLYYRQDYLISNLDRIDEIDMTGRYLPLEFKEALGRELLNRGYQITDKTPRYLMQTREFLAEYVIQHPESIDSIGLKKITSLITIENFKKSQNIRKLIDLLPEGTKTPISLYIDAWGKEKTYELLENFGDATKYLNRSISYTVETAREDLIAIFKSGGIQKVSDAISLISNLGIKVSEEDFASLGELRKNSKLFEKLLDNNPEYIAFYKGSDSRIFEKAIARGAFDEKTEEEIESLLVGTASDSSAVMKYLLDNGYGKFITKYNGNDSMILAKALDLGIFDNLPDAEIQEFIKTSPIAKYNKDLFNFLIEEKSSDYIFKYEGYDRQPYIKAIEVGAFDGKTEEQLQDILKEDTIRSQEDVMTYLIENYRADLIEKYTGNNEKVFEKALEMGYQVDIEKLKSNIRLLESDTMFNEAIAKNPKVAALRFSRIPAEEIENILEKLYDDNFLTEQKKHVFSGLCSVLNNDAEAGLNLLQAFNPELVDTLGLDNWRTLIRYAIRQPNLKSLVEITENGKLGEFLNVYKLMSDVIVDDVALGINKFLNIANFYKIQPEFCEELIKVTNEGREFSDIDKINLQTLVYNASNYTDKKLNLDELENLVGSDKQKFIEELESKSQLGIKSDLMQYLFNMDISSAKDLLSHDINSKVVSEILNGAKKSKNQSLQLEAEYMSVLVDTLEQIYYFNGKEEQLKEFAKRLYSLDEKEIFKIRKEFVNIRETVRKFYERDAQEELTDIKALANDERYYTYYKKDGMDTPIKVIDISKMKHTVYCHVLGTSVDAMFDRDEGRPTICVSPETDMHEAFYYHESGIILVFSEIPNGSFIGSAPANMGSNNSIKNNDYKIDGILSSLKQMGIRQSHSEDGHAETLLYRAGLIPTGVKMVGDVPSKEEIQAARDLERKIFEITGEKVEIPIIKTQHEKNRVVRYQGNITEEKELAEYTEKARRVQALRKEFMGIIDLPEIEGVAVRQDYDKKDYTIIDGQIYTLNPREVSLELSAEKVAKRLEHLVYGEESDIPIDIQEVQGQDGKEYEAKKQPSARNMWHYSRLDGSFAPEVNSVMLQEFLVDHLMCNYSSSNKSFVLDENNIAHPITKKGAFRKKEDFVTADGKPYTAMSYLYYDGEEGSNLYRRSFENYIYNPEKTEILKDEELQAFITKAQEISQMNETEYLEIFSPLLSSVDDYSERSKIQEAILARKANAGQDAISFVDRLKRLRQIEQEPEIVESASDIAFMNDIHGNLAAVQSIIEDCKKTGKKTIYVLGDMIGFGPQSNECLDALRDASKDIEIKCILGNHEMYSLMGNQNFVNSYGFDPGLTEMTRKGLSPENREFLEGLPISRKLIIEGKKVELTHFPVKPRYERDQEIYLEHGAEVTESNSGLDQEYLIYGHEHRTEFTTGNDVGTVLITERPEVKVTYINLPSSGCVHGKNTSYVLFRMKDGKLEPEVKPVEYDKKQIEEAVRRTNNPKGHFFGVGGQDGR